MATITAQRVVTPAGVIAPGAVEIDAGRIVAVAPTKGVVGEGTLVPGFIDVQLNGFDDVDVSHAAGADWDRLDELLLRQGVTAWCPTIVTRPLDSYAVPLAHVASAAARDGLRPAILGAHLEGPFLGGAPGAHPTQLIRPLDLKWLAAMPAIVRIMTLAPEQPATVDAVRMLTEREVVVALGHSTASYEDATAAIDAGARLATHMFNGMGPLHHRRLGLAGAVLTDDRIAVSVIADLHHVHPAGLRLVFRAKQRGSVVLVSDAVAWRDTGALAAGVALVDGAAQFPNGTLVGCTVGLDGAVRNVVNHAGVDIADAVYAASTAPADLLGATDRGRIAVGARADLVSLDGDLAVTTTWIAGERA
jgi:N-acetylglucosamine-6-phosphate deacetylase